MTQFGIIYHTTQELQELQKSIHKNNPISDQNYFFDSESTTASSIEF